MSEEKKIEELTDEELRKVSGGDDKSQAEGNCGITTTINGCTQYNGKKTECLTCRCKPRVVNIPLVPGDGSFGLEIGWRRGGKAD